MVHKNLIGGKDPDLWVERYIMLSHSHEVRVGEILIISFPRKFKLAKTRTGQIITNTNRLSLFNKVFIIKALVKLH